MPYKDTAIPPKLTIGYGRNLDDCGISDDEAEYLLGNDIAKHSAELFRALPWAETLALPRRAVLQDMAFNMGVPGLLKFKNMLRAVQLSEWGVAAHEMLDSLWARQVGNRAQRLSQMMQSGEWPDEVED